jgi:hypothetical protein
LIWRRDRAVVLAVSSLNIMQQKYKV